MSRSPYRRHSPQFKLQLRHDIRAGTIGRNEAQRKYALSANLVHLWLTQYDRGELDVEEVEATVQPWSAAMRRAVAVRRHPLAGP